MISWGSGFRWNCKEWREACQLALIPKDLCLLGLDTTILCTFSCRLNSSAAWDSEGIASTRLADL